MEHGVEIIPFEEDWFREAVKWNEADEKNASRIEKLLEHDIRIWQREWNTYDGFGDMPMNVKAFAKKLGDTYLLMKRY